MVDDDDDVENCFIEEIMKVITDTDYDLVTFNQYATINDGNKFTIFFSINNENEEAKIINGKWVDVKRKPFHNMVWKSEIAKSESFNDLNGCEDWDWAKRLIPKVKTSFNIDKHLTIYRFNSSITESRNRNEKLSN